RATAAGATMTIAAIAYVLFEIVLIYATQFAVGAVTCFHTAIALLAHFLVLTVMTLAAFTIAARAAVATKPAIIAGSLIVITICVTATFAGPTLAFLGAALFAPLTFGADVVLVELAFAIVAGYA